MSRRSNYEPEIFDPEFDEGRPEPETMTEEELSSLADDLSACPAFMEALLGKEN